MDTYGYKVYTMDTNIQDVLALEIKKEIADRYFGFRKLIEEDQMALTEKIQQYNFILEKRISFDLIRTYVLLNQEELIQSFLELIGLEERMFFDPYLLESQTVRQRVFEGIHLRGLTWSARFRNLLFDCVERLTVHVDQYQGKFEELQAYRQQLEEEIDLFQQKTDLGSILGFLRSLGDQSKGGGMQGGMEPGIADDLTKKLAYTIPQAAESFPKIAPLPPMSAISSKLNLLATKAYAKNHQEFRHFFWDRITPGWLGWQRMF